MNYATMKRRVPREERLCTIHTRDGVRMELRGADAPSVGAVLLFFKRRKLAAIQAKRAKVGGSEDLSSKQRMARDLNDRLAGRGGDRSIQVNQRVDLAPWWQKFGSLQMIRENC
jgi:hypothetical protein